MYESFYTIGACIVILKLYSELSIGSTNYYKLRLGGAVEGGHGRQIKEKIMRHEVTHKGSDQVHKNFLIAHLCKNR